MRTRNLSPRMQRVMPAHTAQRSTALRGARLVAALVLMPLVAPLLAAEPSRAQVFAYAGPCDASAAAPIDAEHFVVGNDEHNALLIYRRGQAASVASVALDAYLGTGGGKEADIEAAAPIDKRIYWITSHGRNSKGKAQESRHRIFATDVVDAGPGRLPRLVAVGTPYRDLLRDIDAAPLLAPYGLAAAARRPAEAEGGFNIEGLAATPDGGLLIGLRNPLVRGRALVIALENPGEILEGRRARLSQVFELDLGGRGVRSIERHAAGYLIVAGPTADAGSFALYRWSGLRGEPAVAVAGVELGSLRPEAVLTVPGTSRIQLFSDDGGLKVGGVECKKLPAARQTFRSLELTP